MLGKGSNNQMKKIILLFIMVPIFLFSQAENHKAKTFYIDKNNQGGFNIYNSEGELVYGYTKRNTDSLSLQTLDEIFFEADSLNDKLTKVEIVNIPQNSLYDKYAPYLSVLIGVFFGWLFSYFSQKKLIREQFKLQQQKEWLAQFIETTANFSSALNAFESVLSTILRKDSPKEVKEKFIHSTEYTTFQQNTFQKSYIIMEFLDTEIPMEKRLIELYNKLIDKLNEGITVSDTSSVSNDLSKLNDEINETVSSIIKQKRYKLKNL